MANRTAARLVAAAACAAGIAAAGAADDRSESAAKAKGPDQVFITWLSVTNILYQVEGLGILTDGYITRIPREEFYGGGGGYAFTRHTRKPDLAAVQRVLDAIGGKSTIDLLLTGHSHWDHSFDTATWSQLTGAPILGSRTTCFEATAQGLPEDRCEPIYGGEKLDTPQGVTIRVIRWNHSGDSNKNPEQHQPVELCNPPTPDADGGLHAGVAEDFPNGGGNRAFLFTVESARGRYSWFYQNSASAADLGVNIIMDGTDYGAPIENLKKVMREAGVDHVDLWIGTGGLPIAKLLVPILKPRAYIPVHWDDFFAPFERGVISPFSDPELEPFLTEQNVRLLAPKQYMDKWRLDATGIEPVSNEPIKRKLGFSNRGTAER